MQKVTDQFYVGGLISIDECLKTPDLKRLIINLPITESELNAYKIALNPKIEVVYAPIVDMDTVTEDAIKAVKESEGVLTFACCGSGRRAMRAYELANTK